MRKMRVIGLLMWSVLCTSALMGQVSLRNRVVLDQSVDTCYMSCGVSFTLRLASGDPVVHTCLGTEEGSVVFYKYLVHGGVPVRVGRVSWGYRIMDMDDAVIDNSSRMLALVDSLGNVLLWRYDGGSVVPYGVAGLNASRVQLEHLGSNQYLLVVGRRDGRVRCYVWVPGTPAGSLGASLSLGTPAYEGWWYSGAVVSALRVWSSGGVVYAVFGGGDGLVYLCRWDGSSLVQRGKGRYHPSEVSEIVVNGSRVVVGCSMGHVYVWNWSESGLSYHLDMKYVASRLEAHSLSALVGDRVAVGTGHVRVYSLANGSLVGLFGSGSKSRYLLGANGFWYGGFSRQNHVRVLPNSVGYFVIGVGWLGGVRFVQGSLSYSLSSYSSYPVNGLAEASGGVVSVYGDGQVRAPWGTRNVGAPVMCVMGVSGTPAWVLGSYGVGRVFGWSSSGSFVADVLPAPSLPRVVSVLRVLSVSGTVVRFVVGSYSGDLEVWEWQLGSSGVATKLSGILVGGRVTDISVSPDKSNVLVASGGGLRRVPVGSNGSLGSAQVLIANDNGVFSAQYHPTDNTRAVVSISGSLRVFTLSPSVWSTVLWFYPYNHEFMSSPLIGYCMWANSTEVVTAAPYQSYVGVFESTVDTVMASQLFTGGANGARGSWDRALREVYNGEEGNVSALLAMSDGSLVCGTSRGRVVRWVRGGRVVATSYVDGPVNTIDWAAQSGVRVLPSRVYLTAGKHALLMGDYSYEGFPSPVLALSGGSGIQARVMSPNYSHDVSLTDVVIKHRWTGFANYQPSYFPVELWNVGRLWARLESSEDGQWLLMDHQWYYRQVGSGYEYWCALHLVPESKYFTGTTASEFYRVQFPTPATSGSYNMSALSPGGVRVAVGLSNNEVRVYDRVGSSWNFSSPSSVLNVVLPVYFHLRFLADDVLLLAYPESGSGVRVEVYQLSGGSWVLRSSLATGSGYNFVRTNHLNHYIVDSLLVGSVVRVALSTSGGLVFYKLTRSGGVVSLTEVGRTSALAQGFMDMGSWWWVRFSRYGGHGGNYLGVALHNQSALVYNLQGLFSW